MKLFIGALNTHLAHFFLFNCYWFSSHTDSSLVPYYSFKSSILLSSIFYRLFLVLFFWKQIGRFSRAYHLIHDSYLAVRFFWVPSGSGGVLAPIFLHLLKIIFRTVDIVDNPGKQFFVFLVYDTSVTRKLVRDNPEILSINSNHLYLPSRSLLL